MIALTQEWGWIKNPVLGGETPASTGFYVSD